MSDEPAAKKTKLYDEYKLHDLGIKNPDVVIAVQHQDTLHGFPVRLNELQVYSSVWSDAFTHASPEEPMRDLCYNGLKLPVRELFGDDPQYIGLLFSHMYRDMPFKPYTRFEDVQGVYILARKYQVDRVSDWTRDRIQCV